MLSRLLITVWAQVRPITSARHRSDDLKATSGHLAYSKCRTTRAAQTSCWWPQCEGCPDRREHEGCEGLGSRGWVKGFTWAFLELTLETCLGVHQSENGCDGWNLLLAVPANDLRATASSERCVQIQGCKDNRSSLWTKALSEAVNPTSCIAQHPEIVWFLLKGWQGKGVLVESSLADRDWPRLLLALPGCWIFKWKLGLRSWTELWELSCGQEM